MRPMLVALFGFLALASAAPRASAQGKPASKRPETFHPPPRVPVAATLDFSLGGGSRNCPGREYLQQEVSRRLGHDPFEPDANGVPVGNVRVIIERAERGPGLTGTFTYTNAAGVEKWTRKYHEPSTVREACKGVMKGIAVELSGEFLVQEITLAEAPPPAPPSPPTPEPPPAPEAVPISPAPSVQPVAELPAKSEAPPLRARFEIGAGALAAYGIVPAPSFGGVVHLGVQLLPFERGLWFSVAAEGRADVSASRSIDPRYGQYLVRATLFGAAALACLHDELTKWSRASLSFFGCGTGTVGRLGFAYNDGLSVGLSSATRIYAAFGARLGIEAQIGSRVAIRLHGAALGNAYRARVTSSQSPEIMRTPDASFEGGASALFLLGSGVQ